MGLNAYNQRGARYAEAVIKKLKKIKNHRILKSSADGDQGEISKRQGRPWKSKTKNESEFGKVRSVIIPKFRA